MNGWMMIAVVLCMTSSGSFAKASLHAVIAAQKAFADPENPGLNKESRAMDHLLGYLKPELMATEKTQIVSTYIELLDATIQPQMSALLPTFINEVLDHWPQRAQAGFLLVLAHSLTRAGTAAKSAGKQPLDWVWHTTLQDDKIETGKSLGQLSRESFSELAANAKLSSSTLDDPIFSRVFELYRDPTLGDTQDNYVLAALLERVQSKRTAYVATYLDFLAVAQARSEKFSPANIDHYWKTWSLEAREALYLILKRATHNMQHEALHPDVAIRRALAAELQKRQLSLEVLAGQNLGNWAAEGIFSVLVKEHISLSSRDSDAIRAKLGRKELDAAQMDVLMAFEKSLATYVDGLGSQISVDDVVHIIQNWYENDQRKLVQVLDALREKHKGASATSLSQALIQALPPELAAKVHPLGNSLLSNQMVSELLTGCSGIWY